MSLKRSGVATPSQSKKSKTSEVNYFETLLQESGLTLKRPPDKSTITQETIHIIRNIKKNLQKHFDYPRNLSEFFTIFEKECHDLNIFKHYLFPNIVCIAEDTLEGHCISDSVIKILLSIPPLQGKIIDYIFEKAIDLAAESKCGPWIQMILRNISTLDIIVNSEKVATNLINLLDVTSEEMVRLEIITAIPDIIGDQEHNNIASEMSRILSEEHNLIPAILDCLSYLCISDEQYEILQKKTLNILMTLSKCHYFPNFVKFLLIPGRLDDNGYLEAVQGLRNALNWPMSIAKPEEIASSQVLTARAIRSSITSSKVIAQAWIKVVSNCKWSADHKPIDFIILLILYSTSEERQKQLENIVKKQVKYNILKEDLLDEAFEKFKPILKDYLRDLINFTNSLLKTKVEPTVQAFASHVYKLMLSELNDCCQTIVAELLQLGLDCKQSVMNILMILNNAASKDMSLLKTQSLQMLNLLDRMDDMTLPEIRAVMNLVCGLAYSYENSMIRDDIHMIIRKELASSNPAIKIHGILAGIHAVKYLMASDTEEQSEKIAEAKQIIELIDCSTTFFPVMTAFCYDELSMIIQSTSNINKDFLDWLTNKVTSILEQHFIVDSIENDRIDNLKLRMQYCLNTESEIEEMCAINIAGSTLQVNDEIRIEILSPLFQLVQKLHFTQNDGNLSSIDSLLGCPVVMPNFDVDTIEEMDNESITRILDCLVHCVNWFREVLNAFALQKDPYLKSKILSRVLNIIEVEDLIRQIILKCNILYKPPVCLTNTKSNTSEQIVKPQILKQKVQKKPVLDESNFPETVRATQGNANTVKNKLDIISNLTLRPLGINLLNILNDELNIDNESETRLSLNILEFLLKCLNFKLGNILLSKIKVNTFLTQQVDVEIYDSKKAEECATTVSIILPKIMEHLQLITVYFDDHDIDNTRNESGFMYTAKILKCLSSLEQIFIILTTYFKWMGFRSHHIGLLKSSLRTIVSADQDKSISMKDLVFGVAKHLQKHQKYCLQLSTAVSLIELIKAIQGYSSSKVTFKIMSDMAQTFLSQQWKSPDGVLEKGNMFNQHVDSLVKVFFMNNEISALKTVTLQLMHDVQALESHMDTLNSLKCINKGSFPILYRNLGTAVYEAAQLHLNRRLTNNEHLEFWKEIVTILKSMTEMIKVIDSRNLLATAFFKKSHPILSLFVSQGIPMLQIEFKSENQKVLNILRLLQHSTRYLQARCNVVTKKDSVMNKVPYMKKLLETLIYKVKALLTANNCSEAFWMKNVRNLSREDNSSQQSDASEESVEDCDDQLPDEDDSDDELINPESGSISDIV